MSMVTRCPHCATAFRITSGALKAHQGLVRCGHCSEVFNAFDTLSTLHDAPARSIPEAEIAELLEAPAEVQVSPEPASLQEDAFETLAEEEQVPQTMPDASAQEADEAHPADDFAEPVKGEEDLGELFVGERPSRFRWLWSLGSALLLVAMLAQSVYYWRMELSIAMPGLRPAMVAYCALLDCTIPLPRKTDLIGIESSSLQAEPHRVGVLDLHASIRNSAPFSQAYPLIELTLTDAQDTPLARRIFEPREYLPSDSKIGEGIPANGAANARVDLDTGSLLPSGYRLYLFYP